VQDPRPNANQQPLRRSQHLSFLPLLPTENEAPGTNTNCLYEAQISCLVSGIDQWSWVAYAFVDTYYKGANNTESATFYRDSILEETESGGVKPDALSGGRLDANRPVWWPKEYFLRVLEPRVEQVKQEWLNTVSRLLSAVELYVSISSCAGRLTIMETETTVLYLC